MENLIESFLEKFSSFAAQYSNEIPSFTQIYQKEKFIAESYNLVEDKKNTFQHSEIRCIEESQKLLNAKFLLGTTLITAIEPCLMCAGAIIHSRISEVVYFLEATKTEGITSLSIESIYSKNHFPKLIFHHSEIVEERVKAFFKNKRS